MKNNVTVALNKIEKKSKNNTMSWKIFSEEDLAKNLSLSQKMRKINQPNGILDN